MYIRYFGTSLLGSVLAVSVVKPEEVVKPVVPKYCEQLCKETAGCCSFSYEARDLSCHLNTMRSHNTSGRHLLQNAMDVKEMTCPNDMQVKNKSQQCERFFKSRFMEKGKKGKRCSGNKRKAPNDLEAKKKQPICVLFKRENIRCPKGKAVITVPSVVRKGMKITLCGSYVSKRKKSTYVVFPKMRKPSDIIKVFYIILDWSKKSVIVLHNETPHVFKGDFPICDPTHFTLELYLTSNSTKTET